MKPFVVGFHIRPKSLAHTWTTAEVLIGLLAPAFPTAIHSLTALYYSLTSTSYCSWVKSNPFAKSNRIQGDPCLGRHWVLILRHPQVCPYQHHGLLSSGYWIYSSALPLWRLYTSSVGSNSWQFFWRFSFCRSQAQSHLIRAFCLSLLGQFMLGASLTIQARPPSSVCVWRCLQGLACESRGKTDALLSWRGNTRGPRENKHQSKLVTCLKTVITSVILDPRTPDFQILAGFLNSNSFPLGCAAQ